MKIAPNNFCNLYQGVFKAFESQDCNTREPNVYMVVRDSPLLLVEARNFTSCPQFISVDHRCSERCNSQAIVSIL